MVRHTLSQPMSLLVQHGLIRPTVSVFDYGCGQGDDLRALATNGIDANGWDPHFEPDRPRFASEVVNLGFVLNVIEDVEERRQALDAAWQLTRKVLAVSTMIVGQVSTEGLTPFGDGFVTSRGTFQKYFAHAELRAFIAKTLGSDPVAAAPGIFFLFRRDEDQEEYLLRRRIGRRVSTATFRSQRPFRPDAARPDVGERIAPALTVIADLMRLRGRPPHLDELPADTLDLLAQERVSVQRAVDLSQSDVLGPGELEDAARLMREDLLVHYALARLGAKGGGRPSAPMIRDIRAHFGNQRELQSSATEYLMGLGDEKAMRKASEEAVGGKVAAIDHRGRLVLDARRSEELPGVLRVYIGCASVLAGEPEGDSLIRIDIQNRKVDQIRIETRKAAFPRLPSSTRIDLKRQSVTAARSERLLIGKSVLLGPTTKAQKAREEKYRTELGIDPAVLIMKVP